jgi:hypothetical protein
VKLFFDENFGSRIPEALQKLGAPCEVIDRPRRGGPIELGTSDIDWIAAVGRDGFLGLSEDVAILRSSVERAALVDAGAGVVFFEDGRLDQVGGVSPVAPHLGLARTDRSGDPAPLRVRRVQVGPQAADSPAVTATAL